LWDTLSDVLVRNNRYDDVKMVDLGTFVVAFATARQFNEALFIDVERSVI